MIETIAPTVPKQPCPRSEFVVEEAASTVQLRHVWKMGHVVMVKMAPNQNVEGRVSIIPANTQFPAPRETGRVVAAALKPSFITCCTAALGGAHAELRDVREVSDALIVQLVTALRSETGNDAFAEALAIALAMHLVSHYSVSRSEAREADRGLGGRRLRAVVDYINANLGRDISIAALAAVTDLSPSHFIRMFQNSTGLSPHQYVLRARVLRAQELLRRTRHSIADIAEMTGFCGQSHFTKHFGRILGTTPRRYRRNAQT